jgi:2'-hydroxyisoflavone reductase
MKLLVLGGTGFLGPHVVESAVAGGHTVTLFNRGRRNPALFPDLEKIQGDRATDELDGLKGRTWDAVIDTHAVVPRWVKSAAELLKDSVKTYLFVSTVSVYSDFSKPGIDESVPVRGMDDESDEKFTMEKYGPMKATCERVAERIFAGRATIIRPGLIVGPGDDSDRFTYWPTRMDRGGEVLAPGDPASPQQFIDARDLAAFIVRTLEEGHVGVYNALGPRHRLTTDQLLHGVRAVTSAGAQLTWVSDEFLLEQGVGPWMELPLWIPSRDPSMFGFARVSNARAVSHGLEFRPLADTARDTLLWARQQPERPRRAGLDPEKEAKVLREWHQRNGTKPPTGEPWG